MQLNRPGICNAFKRSYATVLTGHLERVCDVAWGRRLSSPAALQWHESGAGDHEGGPYGNRRLSTSFEMCSVLRLGCAVTETSRPPLYADTICVSRVTAAGR